MAKTFPHTSCRNMLILNMPPMTAVNYWANLPGHNNMTQNKLHNRETPAIETRHSTHTSSGHRCCLIAAVDIKSPFHTPTRPATWLIVNNARLRQQRACDVRNRLGTKNCQTSTQTNDRTSIHLMPRTFSRTVRVQHKCSRIYLHEYTARTPKQIAMKPIRTQQHGSTPTTHSRTDWIKPSAQLSPGHGCCLPPRPA